MKELQIKKHRPQPTNFEQTLDMLFSEPPKEAIESAKSRLIKTLAEAEYQAIFFGKIKHPTTHTLFLAMRKQLVVMIEFGITEEEFLKRVEKRFKEPIYFDPDKTKAILEQIKNYLDGQRPSFDIQTDISDLTDFQQRVLKATQQIPRGRIVTYMEIAREIGNPKAVRAVGQALGRNPIPIVIPCHRVIASNGSLGGYSGGGGLETKSKLLQLEGALLGEF